MIPVSEEELKKRIISKLTKDIFTQGEINYLIKILASDS